MQRAIAYRLTDHEIHSIIHWEVVSVIHQHFLEIILYHVRLLVRKEQRQVRVLHKP